MAPIWLLVVAPQPGGNEGHAAHRFADHLSPDTWFVEVAEFEATM